jgi:high-affinity K+ transport system ATPase subunit B
MLIEEDGKIVGLLSIGDVIKADLNAKTKELQELHAMVNWDYYDNWRWEKK